MLVRSVALDLPQKSLINPIQETKQELQEHLHAKSIKIGTMALDPETRKNLDAPAGLHVNHGVREKARAVDEARRKKKEIDEKKRKENEKLNMK